MLKVMKCRCCTYRPILLNLSLTMIHYFIVVYTFKLIQTKQVYEKVGEATETALVVLAEKMNVLGIDRSKLSRKALSSAGTQAIQKLWQKDFTLEFSRDRKSMSCFCTPVNSAKVGTSPKMFVKVHWHLAYLILFINLAHSDSDTICYWCLKYNHIIPRSQWGRFWQICNAIHARGSRQLLFFMGWWIGPPVNTAM